MKEDCNRWKLFLKRKRTGLIKKETRDRTGIRWKYTENTRWETNKVRIW